MSPFDIYKGVWATLFGPNSTGTSVSALVVNTDGSINTVSSGSSPAGTATDKSFTTSGADATVIAANSARLGYMIENPIAAALNANGDSIYVNLGAVATNGGASFEVTPGGYFPPPGMPLYTGAIHVIGATGVKCPAKEYTT